MLFLFPIVSRRVTFLPKFVDRQTRLANAKPKNNQQKGKSKNRPQNRTKGEGGRRMFNHTKHWYQKTFPSQGGDDYHHTDARACKLGKAPEAVHKGWRHNAASFLVLPEAGHAPGLPYLKSWLALRIVLDYALLQGSQHIFYYDTLNGIRAWA